MYPSEYERDPGLGHRPHTDRHDAPGDSHYLQWRSEQLRRCDDDYRRWCDERYQRFCTEFGAWREQRQRSQHLSQGPGRPDSGALQTPALSIGG